MCLFERPVPRQGRDGIEAPTDRLQPVERRFCERDGGELSGSKQRSDLGDGGVERFLRCHFAGRMGRKTNAGAAPIVAATLRSFSAVDRSCATDFSTLRRSAAERWDGTGLFAGAGAPRKAFGRASTAGPDRSSRAAALRVIRVGILTSELWAQSISLENVYPSTSREEGPLSPRIRLLARREESLSFERNPRPAELRDRCSRSQRPFVPEARLRRHGPARAVESEAARALGHSRELSRRPGRARGERPR